MKEEFLLHIYKKLSENFEEDFKEHKISMSSFKTYKKHKIFSSVKFSLLHLPDLVLEMILEYFSFQEIADLRLVCQKFNYICQNFLNRAFRSVQEHRMNCLKQLQDIYERSVKNPDFEISTSLVEDHIKALNKLDTRLCLLDLTFLVPINDNRCCFFPGKVLDEIYDPLWLIKRELGVFCQKFEDEIEVVLNFIRERFSSFKSLADKAIKYAIETIFPTLKGQMTVPRVIGRPSVPYHFDDVVLRSLLLNLRYKDIVRCYRNFEELGSYKKEELESISKQLQSVLITDDCYTSRGFDLGFNPERILGKTFHNNQMLYLIKWKDINEAEFVSELECEEKFPRLFQQYNREKNQRCNQGKNQRYNREKHWRYIQKKNKLLKEIENLIFDGLEYWPYDIEDMQYFVEENVQFSKEMEEQFKKEKNHQYDEEQLSQLQLDIEELFLREDKMMEEMEEMKDQLWFLYEGCEVDEKAYDSDSDSSSGAIISGEPGSGSSSD